MSDINIVSFLVTILRLGNSCLAVEDVTDDLVAGLDLIGRATWHEVKQLHMDVESEFSVFAGLSINLFGLFSTGFSVLEVSKSITDAEVIFIFHLTYVYLLQFVKQLVIIKNLRI